MNDELAHWAAARADDLIARAEAEAVAELKAALLAAVSRRTSRAPSVTRQSPDRAPAPRADGETLVWAYFVTRDSEPTPSSVRGLDGEAVERVQAHGLAAAVSKVPAAEYGEAALRDSLNDLAWLQRVARTHETVLEQAGEGMTIVPLRLCTIFNDEAAVERMLEENAEAFSAALEHLAGRQEWAVKLLVDPERLEAACAGADDPATGAGAGTAYMLGRRAERERRAAADRLGRELAEDVHARLQDWAVDAVVNPPQTRELSGHVGEMLLNGAYLVETARAGELRALATELEQRHQAVGARIEVTGPLPPFNFVRPDRGPHP